MGKIKTNVNANAGDEICQQMIDAAAATGSPGGSATPVRDSNGKIVQVVLDLPDVDAPGLANASQKISENPGVATTVTFPLTIAEDWEDLGNDGDEVISNSGGRVFRQDGTLIYEGSGLRPTNVEATSPLNGTKSVRQEYGGSASTRTNSVGRYKTDSTFLGFSKMEVASFELTIHMTEIPSGTGLRDWSSSLQTQRTGGGGLDYRFQASDSFSNNNYWIVDNNTNTPLVDTGVAADAVLTCKVEWDAIRDEVKYYANGSLVHTQATSVTPFSGISAQWSAGSGYTSGNEKTAIEGKHISDDCTIKVYSGLF